MVKNSKEAPKTEPDTTTAQSRTEAVAQPSDFVPPEREVTITHNSGGDNKTERSNDPADVAPWADRVRPKWENVLKSSAAHNSDVFILADELLACRNALRNRLFEEAVQRADMHSVSHAHNLARLAKATILREPQIFRFLPDGTAAKLYLIPWPKEFLERAVGEGALHSGATRKELQEWYVKANPDARGPTDDDDEQDDEAEEAEETGTVAATPKGSGKKSEVAYRYIVTVAGTPAQMDTLVNKLNAALKDLGLKDKGKPNKALQAVLVQFAEDKKAQVVKTSLDEIAAKEALAA